MVLVGGGGGGGGFVLPIDTTAGCLCRHRRRLVQAVGLLLLLAAGSTLAGLAGLAAGGVGRPAAGAPVCSP